MKKTFFLLGALVSALSGCGSTGSGPLPSAGASTQSAPSATNVARDEAFRKAQVAQGMDGVDTSGNAAIKKQLGDELRAWQSARPRRYRFDYTVTGFAAGGGPWQIEVDGDKIVAVTYVGQGPKPIPPITAAYAPTVEQLFAQVERMLNSEGTQVKASFDAALHYPKEAYFSHGMEADGFKVEGLTKIP